MGYGGLIASIVTDNMQLLVVLPLFVVGFAAVLFAAVLFALGGAGRYTGLATATRSSKHA